MDGCGFEERGEGWGEGWVLALPLHLRRHLGAPPKRGEGRISARNSGYLSSAPSPLAGEGWGEGALLPDRLIRAVTPAHPEKGARAGVRRLGFWFWRYRLIVALPPGCRLRGERFDRLPTTRS